MEKHLTHSVPVNSCEMFPTSEGYFYSRKFGIFMGAEIQGDFIIIAVNASYRGILSIIGEFLKSQYGKSGEIRLEYANNKFKIKIPYLPEYNKPIYEPPDIYTGSPDELLLVMVDGAFMSRNNYYQHLLQGRG